MIKYRALFGPIAVIALFMIGTRWSPFEPHHPPADPSGDPTGMVSWADEDWDAFAAILAHADEAGLGALPMGEVVVAVGRRFVGTAYVPGTLEVEGPERLVINFRGLDCVTFVENVLALSFVIKTGGTERLADRAALETEYELAVRALRYRNGMIDGYPSRLHYFSEWIADNQRKRLLTDITKDLGGVPDREPIGFMSMNPEAYRQLADPRALEDIETVERRLSQQGRHYVPQERIADVAGQIRNGDIIAATSTLAGLDVAHTGLAIWIDDELHLMHAPLVGESVQISGVPLAERIRSIGGQDGIIVARPHEPGAATVPVTTTRSDR